MAKMSDDDELLFWYMMGVAFTESEEKALDALAVLYKMTP